MRRFERGNNSLEFRANSKSVERFGITGVDVLGSPAVVKKCVLGSDRCVIEASRNRMRRWNLSALILKNVRHGALQNADSSATTRRRVVEPGRVFP